MPSTELIIWSGISGLIVIMLGVIGWLVKTGFDGLRRELKALWDKLDFTQTETHLLKERVVALEIAGKNQKENCTFHLHRRSTDEET